MSTLTKLLEADTPKYTTVLPISNKKITYRQDFINGHGRRNGRSNASCIDINHR